MAEKLRIPDPILAQPKHKKMTFKREALIVLFIGFLAGWVWMTWAMVIEKPLGLGDVSFFRLLLPF
ncbi:hypothetical protein L6259_03445 [Candidatus Parcubacteria bacterium]|nr:hypothetical protein [Patescibacteria group bacterium]MCG2694290.1 hypothetical protein [Candidatus Parcubacteria bacterium]